MAPVLLALGRALASRKAIVRCYRWMGSVIPVRDTRFRELTEVDIEALRESCGGDAVTDCEELHAFNADWLHKYEGKSRLVLRPHSTEQVSKVMSYCHQHDLAVVPQGGNTGLVGGSVPVFDEVVVSLSRMNKVISFDENAGVVVSEAGCILQFLDEYLAKVGHMMPLDLGAKGSCQIGGNVATNAGGIRLVRYGSLRGTVLGLEAVLADGTILDMLSTLRKDNTGYDLKQLLIGSEGSLGIITKVAIMTPRVPRTQKLAFVGLNSYDNVLLTLRRARNELGELLSAVEFMDRESLDHVLTQQPGAQDPLPDARHAFYMVLETSSGNAGIQDEERINEFLMKSIEEGLVYDAIVAQDTTQMKKLWALREGVAESLTRQGAVYKYDLSVPVECMYELVEEMRLRLKPHGVAKENVCGYGHVGDGNLHLNVLVPTYCDKISQLVEPFIYERTAARRGSISAEHGLGLMKSSEIGYSKSPESVALMKQIKSVMDPKGILNPYKLCYMPAETS